MAQSCKKNPVPYGIDARSTLRHETEAAHVRVEALLGLGGAAVALPAYLAALEALAAVYNSVAAWLPGTHVRHLAAGSWQRLSVHLARLQADVRYIREHVGCPADATLPRVAAPPAGWGDWHGCGMLYVVEGSTLGGQHVARHMARGLGLDPTRGLAFFHGDGHGTGPLWRAFCADLTLALSTGERVALAVAGARWTFEAVEGAWAQSAASYARGR